jgi:hypothetical protein
MDHMPQAAMYHVIYHTLWSCQRISFYLCDIVWHMPWYYKTLWYHNTVTFNHSHDHDVIFDIGTLNQDLISYMISGGTNVPCFQMLSPWRVPPGRARATGSDMSAAGSQLLRPWTVTAVWIIMMPFSKWLMVPVHGGSNFKLTSFSCAASSCPADRHSGSDCPRRPHVYRHDSCGWISSSLQSVVTWTVSIENIALKEKWNLEASCSVS